MSSLASTTAASSCASRTQTSLGLCLVLPMKLQRRSSGRAYRPTRAPPLLRQEEAPTALTRRASGCPCTAPSLDTTLALICRNTLRCCCRYKQAAADLVSRGHAYPCFCDTHRLEAAKAAALAKGVSYKYKHTQTGLQRQHSCCAFDRVAAGTTAAAPSFLPRRLQRAQRRANHTSSGYERR